MAVRGRDDGSKKFVAGGGSGHSLLCGSSRLPFPIADIWAQPESFLKGLIALIQISGKCKFADVCQIPFRNASVTLTFNDDPTAQRQMTKGRQQAVDKQINFTE